MLAVAGCRGAAVAPSHPVVRAPVKVEVVTAPPRALGEGPAIVQRETHIHLDEIEGADIGRVFQGVRVRIVHVIGAAAEIAVPEVERPVHAQGGATQAPLTAWVDVASLGTIEVPLVEPPPSGRAVRDHYSRVAERAGEFGFFYTLCGPLQILQQGEKTTRVAQRVAGFELVGWSETPIRGARGDFHCPAHVAETGVPAGFEAAHSVDAAAVLRADRTIHWLVERDDGVYACEDWHVTKKEIRHTSRVKGERFEADYTIEREGSRVVLLGPTIRSGGTESSYGCGADYRAVDLDGDRLVLLPNASRVPRDISAYEPDDAEVWYLSESACKAAAARANEPPSSTSALASIPPLHTGC
jgi:hypothetical protein